MLLSRFIKVGITALALIGTSIVSHAKSARIHIIFFNSRIDDATGNLFFAAHRYRLRVSGVSTATFQGSKLECVGSALNLQRPRDILGTYRAATNGATVISGSQAARLENAQGVVLELHAVNPGRSTLNLADMEINSRGWRAD
jgi:hypothetical protein